MGSTTSGLIWNIGYDPVITVVERASGAVAPAYVDNSSALVTGPRQVASASIDSLAIDDRLEFIQSLHSVANRAEIRKSTT